MTKKETHTFKLPLPPTANLIWRNSYVNGQTYINPKYASWQKESGFLVPNIPHNHCTKWSLEIQFFLYYVHKTANMDVDNRIKPLVDLFKDKIKIDDRYLIKILADRIDVKVPKTRKDHYCVATVNVF